MLAAVETKPRKVVWVMIRRVSLGGGGAKRTVPAPGFNQAQIF